MKLKLEFKRRLALHQLKRKRRNKSPHTVDIILTLSELTLLSDLSNLRYLRDSLQEQFLEDPDSVPVDWNTITLLDQIVERINKAVVDSIMGTNYADNAIHRY